MMRALVLCLSLSVAAAQKYNPGYDVKKVLSVARSVSTKSWEFGTTTEAILEFDNPDNSVFGSNPFGTLAQSASALAYVKPKISLSGNQLVDASGSLGDPASLGVGAVMIGRTDGRYMDAAKRELNTLITNPNRWDNGAISHRVNEKSLWADFVYMAPPFIAYIGAIQNNDDTLRLAFQQCKAYRDVLTSSSGLWRHIQGGPTDTGLWSTGNAWAAAGMARVVATITKARPDWSSERGQLKKMIQDILDGAIAAQPDTANGLLRNYINDASWWGEASGTALLAATAYRMHVIDSGRFTTKYRDWAENVRKTIAGRIDKSTGVLKPTINPMDWRDRNQNWSTNGGATTAARGSPEGQAFAVLLYTAWAGCVDAGKCAKP